MADLKSLYLAAVRALTGNPAALIRWEAPLAGAGEVQKVEGAPLISVASGLDEEGRLRVVLHECGHWVCQGGGQGLAETDGRPSVKGRPHDLSWLVGEAMADIQKWHWLIEAEKRWLRYAWRCEGYTACLLRALVDMGTSETLPEDQLIEFTAKLWKSYTEAMGIKEEAEQWLEKSRKQRVIAGPGC